MNMFTLRLLSTWFSFWLLSSVSFLKMGVGGKKNHMVDEILVLDCILSYQVIWTHILPCSDQIAYLVFSIAISRIANEAPLSFGKRLLVYTIGHDQCPPYLVPSPSLSITLTHWCGALSPRSSLPRQSPFFAAAGAFIYDCSPPNLLSYGADGAS